MAAITRAAETAARHRPRSPPRAWAGVHHQVSRWSGNLRDGLAGCEPAGSQRGAGDGQRNWQTV